jgi:hypothetical protein
MFSVKCISITTYFVLIYILDNDGHSIFSDICSRCSIDLQGTTINEKIVCKYHEI